MKQVIKKGFAISLLESILAATSVPSANGSQIQAPSRKLILGMAVTAILAASTMPAFADGPGWTANAIVTKLVVTSNGGINVRLSPEVNGCVSQSGYGPNYASIYPDHPGINRMKADLLAAFMSGKTVALYLGDSSCRVSEMMLGG